MQIYCITIYLLHGMFLYSVSNEYDIELVGVDIMYNAHIAN